VPDDVKDLFDFSDENEWRIFLEKVETSLRSGSLNDMARELPEIRSVLKHLDAMPAGKPYADWLRPRLDYYVFANEVARRSAVIAPKVAETIGGRGNSIATGRDPEVA